MVLTLEHIAERLQTLSQFRRVSIALDLSQINRETCPSLFLMPLDDDATERGQPQRIYTGIGLVFAVRNLSDGRGAAGLADLSPLRRAVYSTLFGYRPAECLDPFHFRRGRLLHISDGVIWWQDEYQTSFTFPMLSRN